MFNTVTRRALGAASIFALAAALHLNAAAQAPAPQETPAAEAVTPATEQAAPAQPVASEEIVVQGQIAYRNRTPDTAPVLNYGLDYFQRFEPLTVGDALKRVPSVTFLSDVIEADGVRLRGLAPAYTQILIDGERTPGSGLDRSFFVDRIPAELIERVEIVRSASANRSGDAVAGAINIVMRDGYSLDGGFVRAGALHFSDGTWRPAFGGAYGTAIGQGRLLFGFNMQGRRNPKEKFSERFGAPPPDALNFVNREDQTDDRDGTDYSINFSIEGPVGPGELELSGVWVRTDRVQLERSIEYRVAAGTPTTDLLTLNAQDVDIVSDNWTLRGGYKTDLLGGKTKLKLAYSRFTDTIVDNEEEIDFLRDAIPFPEADRFTGDFQTTDLADKEFEAKLEHEHDFGAVTLEAGLHFNRKERRLLVLYDRNRFNVANGTVPPIAAGAYTLLPVPGGNSTIVERRLDPFIMASGKAGDFSWEAGLRYETTEFRINDRTAAPALSNVESEYDYLLPSAHVKWEITAEDRVYLSAARTVRRPDFDQLSPALLEEEVGEQDFQGNPNLRPETAWGFDAGYERRIGSRGVAGINVFYRKVTDLIEVVNTGLPGPNTDLLSVANVGDGEVYGVEFDLSAPLGFIGLDDTGVFVNVSWLDSNVTDFLGSRRFNDQSDYVYNVGFIHDIKPWDAAFGATYRKQGTAFGRIVGEEVTTNYGAELEVFVEKRIGERVTVRLNGQNLLNSRKDETFDKFETLADQIARTYDEYELERETAGPVFQLIVRAAF